MKSILLLALASAVSAAEIRTNPPSPNGTAITPASVSASSISASRLITAAADGTNPVADRWTTDSWGKGYEFGGNGYSLRWPVSGGFSRGIMGNAGVLYFARSTANDNSAAPLYDMTIGAGGVIASATQPRARVTVARPVPAATWYPIFWTNEVTDTSSLFDAAGSSQTITVPSGGGGWYRVNCQVALPLEGTGGVNSYLAIASDGSSCSTYLSRTRRTSVANLINELAISYEGEAAAGATFTCCINTPAAVTPDGNAYHAQMSAVKVW